MSEQLVNIVGTELPIIEYNSQPVITLHMMDVVHGQRSRTAQRNFNQYQDKLIQGEDYEILTNKKLGDFLILFADTKNVFAKTSNLSKVRHLVILYEMGYLMLVKSFHDDLAWQVQRQLLNIYFAHTKPHIQPIANRPTQEMLLYTKATADLLDSFGITGNAKQLALNNSLKKEFGYDALKVWGIDSLTAEVQEQLLTPSDIAKRVGFKSARQVNLKLINLGLQTTYRDSKKRLYYELTEKGQSYALYQDTSKRHQSGEPVRSIKWYEEVIKLFIGTEVSVL